MDSRANSAYCRFLVDKMRFGKPTVEQKQAGCVTNKSTHFSYIQSSVNTHNTPR